MDIKQLKFLIALDETRHFGQAAARCHITQPTLSLAAYDGLQAEAAACRGNLIGTLRLGVVPLSNFDPLHLMQRLHAEHPNLRFELSSLSSEQILEHPISACPIWIAWTPSVSTPCR